jgi:hypothetical protein
MIDLGPGTLYISTADGSYSSLGTVNEAENTIEEDDISEVVPYASLKAMESSFEMVAKVSKELILALTGVTDAVIKCCPNRRVVHLAIYSRKRRTRKKNFHRAIKILEELT